MTAITDRNRQAIVRAMKDRSGEPDTGQGIMEAAYNAGKRGGMAFDEWMALKNYGHLSEGQKRELAAQYQRGKSDSGMRPYEPNTHRRRP